jgi:FkbM family methyltransferase
VSSFRHKLRPAKARSALRRRYFEWRLRRLPLDEGPETVELGSTYGGWRIPAGMLRTGDVCYCVGAGGDISFDLELIRRYGAVVRAVDPVEAYEANALRTAAGEPNFSFRRAAVTTTDGPVRMQPHHETASRALSGAGLYDTDEWVEVAGVTISTLMRELGDDHIDLLKLDVEGIEYELVPTLDLMSFGIHIFAVQLHHKPGTTSDALRLIEGVRRQGFRLVAQRPVVKLTFARSSSDRLA